jgi:hypothetical protein
MVKIIQMNMIKLKLWLKNTIKLSYSLVKKHVLPSDID